MTPSSFAADSQAPLLLQDLQVLQKIITSLAGSPALTETVIALGRSVRQALPGTDFCLFFLHQVENDVLALAGGDWDPGLVFDSQALIFGTTEKLPVVQVFQSAGPLQYKKTGTSEEWGKDPLLQTYALGDLLYIPLRVEQRPVGVLALGARLAGVLTPESRRLAVLIADHIAIFVERSQYYERLHNANEKLEQINRLKTEFISMVSHELRTPLTTIKGFVSIVLNEETGPLNDQQRRFLETSDRAIDRLTLLVSDLLDISRIEAGQIKMQLRPLSLRESFSRLPAHFEQTLKESKLSLTVHLPDNLPLVMADPLRLSQVMENLVSNAVKFTERGGVTVSAADKGDFVMVSVKDTGMGIPKSEQEQIFEKFYQIKTGGAWPAKGTGLGLAIVKSIIDSHHGKVWVESEPGKGADFRFMIPRAHPEASPPAL